MGRKLADLWDYADRLDKRFKCRFCLKDFTGGVVRLRSHLSGVKGGGIQLCSKVSEHAKNDALLSLNAVNKKRKTGPSSSDSDGGSSDICDVNCNNEVGYSVAKYFFMSDTNCNMVESSSFTNLINALNPGSTLPSSLELESKLIPSFKTEVEHYVSGAKESWAKTGCTLIPIFELNEKEGRSFISIFGCSSERTVLLDTFEVPTNVDLVAPFLEETVYSVVQSIGSHNIVQCVVDGFQYGDYFSKFLCSKFPLVYLSKCAAREVQLMFEEIFQDVEWVRTTFNIIKSIVDYIWSDTTLLSLLSKYTNGKELKQSLGVNFLSNYKMLESVLEVKDHLVQLVQSPEWVADYGKGQCGIEVTSYIKNPKTWERGEEVQKALRSLSQVLCSIDIHDSNSGYLYGLMEFVEHSTSQLRSNNQDMYQRLWDIYMLKKGQILSEFHSVAAFLNPAYMRTEQAKNVDRNPVISYIMERFIAEGDREDFVKEVYEYRKILSDRSKLFESTAAKAYHPCQWWETCGQNLTMLRNLAIRILSQPSSASTCKSSMRTVEAVLIKEQRELARGITDLDLKMNAILMERFKKDKAYHERDKIVLEEFSKHRSNNGESTSGPLRQLKLCFMTEIASPIRIGQNVEGKKGCRIHVCLEDTTTGRVVQDGIPSTLPLTISVLDGLFSNEASTEEHSTREYFNRNELPGECPYITGDLGVTLIRGEGTLGNFSFNYNSVDRESGQFKLAVKTHTGFCNGFRILEGISNAFTVEDVEEVSIEQPIAHVDPQNGSFSSNPGLNWASNIDPFTENESDFPLAQWIATPYYPLQGFDLSLEQTASRRVKKKALNWQLQSRGRRRMLKRGSQALKRKRRGEEVFEPKREVYSTGSNNVNGQEEAEKHDEPMELEEVDSLSCCSTSAVARDYISAKPEGFVMTLFGDRVAASSSGADLIRETPDHPSTALQLAIATRVNSVNHQKEDDKAVALKEFVPQLHSISIKKRKGTSKSEAFVVEEMSTDGVESTKEVAYEDDIPAQVKGCAVQSKEETSFKDYEVFLSFRGKDTRCGLPYMLYQYLIDAEIKAFVDNKPATLSGDLIEQTTVMKAIDNSKICVCIFSRTYASSPWCLVELERMAQKNKDVIPVFYGVTPDDVQLKTSMYTDELAMHETKYDKEQVKQWREALIKVGKLKGFQLKDPSLSDSINELVGLISSHLKVKPKYEIKHFVEVDDHINNALSLLDIESGDNRILGIVGMGGICMTTLTQWLFNLVSDNKFDNACFLESTSLKTEMEMIKELHGKKILVLDDGWKTLKRGSQTLKRKSRREEVFEPKREVYSTGSNNVNGQVEAKKYDKPMEVEEVDSLSCCSTSAAHPSTALQLSISTRVNYVNHQKEDDKAEALKEFVPQLHSISIKKRKGIRMFEGTDGAESTKEVVYEMIKNMNRSGDWNSSSCQHLNFQRRDSCQRCGNPKSVLMDFTGRVVSNGASFGFICSDIRPSDWYCAAGNCGTHNFASRSTCSKCGALKDELAGLGRFDSSDSISELVGLISSHLMVKPKYEIQHFVEVEDRINNALSLLDIESGDNRIVGIVGMGGIGMTTLTQGLFNLVSDKFDKACFLESTSLKTEMEMIKEFHGKKILVVLEGVENFNDKGKHIVACIDTSWFGSGSRIIVTTSNRGLLKKMKDVVWYDLAAGLDAFTLYSKNAFGLDSGECSMQQKNRHNGELDMQLKNRHNGGGISRTQRMEGIRMFEGTDGAESTKEVAYEMIKNMNRSGDWNSRRSCQHLNFQRRDSCQRCGIPKSVLMDFAGRVISNGASFGFIGSDIRPGDWYCTAGNCRTHNFASRSTCFKCGAVKDDLAGLGGFDRGFGFGSTDVVGRPNWKSGDSICNMSGHFARRMECFRCNAPRDITNNIPY